MPTGMPEPAYPTDQLDVLRHEFGFVAFAEYGTKSYGIARRALEEAARLRDELDARIAAESADAAAGSYAGRAEEAEARVERAEAALAELRERLGEPCDQWGVRLRDDDPDEDIEIMFSEAQAHGIAAAWRDEIPDTNPTVMFRARYEPGPWREADATSCTALEHAADEQGDGEGGGA